MRRELVKGPPFDPLAWCEDFDGAGQPDEHAPELVAVAGRHVVHDDAPTVVVDPFDPALEDASGVVGDAGILPLSSRASG